MENLLTASELKDEVLKRVKNLEPQVEDECSRLIELLLNALIAGKNSLTEEYNSEVGIIKLSLVKNRLTDLGYKVELREEERQENYYEHSYYYVLNVRI
jgi:hypothetical protein